MDRINKTYNIFLASSMDEFKEARTKLGDFFTELNELFSGIFVRFLLCKAEYVAPEYSPIVKMEDGSQESLNKQIRKCQFAIFLIGRKLGKYTEEEYNVAVDCMKTVNKSMKICVLFFPDGTMDTSAASFVDMTKKDGDYYGEFSNLEGVKLKILQQLLVSILRDEDGGTPEMVRALIQKRLLEIKKLQEVADVPQHDGEIERHCENLEQLVREETGALSDYAAFLEFLRGHPDFISQGSWPDYLTTLDRTNLWGIAKLKSLLGEWYAEQKDYDRAELFQWQALNKYRKLENADYETYRSGNYQFDKAAAYFHLGRALKETGHRIREAEAYLREALRARKELLNDHQQISDTREAELGENQYWLAALLHARQNSGDLEEAKSLYEEALGKLPKESVIWGNLRGQVCNDFASLLSFSGDDFEKARELFEEAIQIRHKLIEKHPSASALGRDYAHSCYEYAMLLKYDDPERAMYYLRNAEEVGDRLNQNGEASLPDYARTCYELGAAYHRSGRLPKAESAYQKAVPLYQKMGEEMARELAQVKCDLANLYNALYKEAIGSEDEEKYFELAKPLYDDAIKIRHRLIERNGASADDNASLAYTYHYYADLLYSRSTHEAKENYRKAKKIYQELQKNSPDAYKAELAQTIYNLATLILGNGIATGRNPKVLEEASKELEEALVIRWELFNNDIQNWDYAKKAADTCVLLARVKAELRLIADSRSRYWETIGLHQKLLKYDHRNIEQCINICREARKFFVKYGFERDVEIIDKILEELERLLPPTPPPPPPPPPSK